MSAHIVPEVTVKTFLKNYSSRDTVPFNPGKNLGPIRIALSAGITLPAYSGEILHVHSTGQ
jgi:hypothetical protein